MENGFHVFSIKYLNGYSHTISEDSPCLKQLVSYIDRQIENPEFSPENYTIYLSERMKDQLEKETYTLYRGNLETIVGIFNTKTSYDLDAPEVYAVKKLKNKHTGSSIDTVREKKAIDFLREPDAIPVPWEVMRFTGIKNIDLAGTSASFEIPGTSTDFGTVSELRAALNYLVDQLGGSVKWD